MTLRRLSFLSVQFGLVLACTTLLSAQLNRGAIEGTVTDPQGAAVSGAEVAIANVETNVETNTKTNSAGYYRAEALVPGSLSRAHFSAKGFATLEITAIGVPAAQVIRVDARLKVGSFNERIEVKAELPMLQTDASNFSSTLQPDIIQNVPLAGRDLQQLTFLLPGITTLAARREPILVLTAHSAPSPIRPTCWVRRLPLTAGRAEPTPGTWTATLTFPASGKT